MGVTEQFSWVDRLIKVNGAPPHDSASTNLLTRVIAAAVTMGARRPILLNAIGIPDIAAHNQLSRFPGETAIRLFEAVEQELGNPALALKIGRDSGPRCFSDIGYATRFLPTLGDVFEANIYMQSLRQNMFRVALIETESRATLRWNLLDRSPREMARLIEFSVSTYVRLAREIWGDGVRIKSVALQHKPRFASTEYSRLLGCTVIFGASITEIEFSLAQLHAPSPKADVRLCAEIQKRQQSPYAWFDAGQRVSALTYFQIFTELNKYPVTLNRVARSFSMSERTLRRKLAEEGQPFRDIVDHARMNLCDLYRIEARRSLGEVAELLGYGELSAFTRAAKRWYGVAPSRLWKDKEGENGGRSKD